jgi:hypothetical protein
MKHEKKMIVAMGLAFLVSSTLHAQDYSDKINSNIGGMASLPLSPTSNFVKTSWGLVGGVGYNFSAHHSVVGEFMWSVLYPTDSSLEPIQVASNDNSITGHVNLYALTGNYRFELQGKRVGGYFIGGGGWYYRTLGFKKPASSGSDTICTPAWVWWGFNCASGMVIPNQIRGSYESSVLGGNIGVGFTIKVAESGPRVYVEPRYHYAPTKNVTTKLMEVTVGIRY